MITVLLHQRDFYPFIINKYNVAVVATTICTILFNFDPEHIHYSCVRLMICIVLLYLLSIENSAPAWRFNNAFHRNAVQSLEANFAWAPVSHPSAWASEDASIVSMVPHTTLAESTKCWYSSAMPPGTTTNYWLLNMRYQVPT